MRLAWFRPRSTRPESRFDDTRALTEALGHTHDVDIIDAERAYAFVYRHASHPFDLCVFDLDDTPDHQYLWPYLVRFSGLALFRTRHFHDERATFLEREQRLANYVTEFQFDQGFEPPLGDQLGQQVIRGGWPMLHVPATAARLVVVRAPAIGRAVNDCCQTVPVRQVPLGVPGPNTVAGPTTPELVVGVVDSGHRELAARVSHTVLRVVHAHRGVRVRFGTPTEVGALAATCEVVVALDWPPRDDPSCTALAAMAGGTALMIFDAEASADWSTLNPQTWQLRGPASAGPPIAVSVDMRDEQHLMALGLERLISDRALRRTLAGSARSWWEAHGTLDAAVAAWELVLQEAATLPRPTRPNGWPRHLDKDGTEAAQEILREFGIGIDDVFGAR